jgi:hypothetical protein
MARRAANNIQRKSRSGFPLLNARAFVNNKEHSLGRACSTTFEKAPCDDNLKCTKKTRTKYHRLFTRMTVKLNEKLFYLERNSVRYAFVEFFCVEFV